MQLLLVKATFIPNNPVCAGFIIAAIPYNANLETTRAIFRELAGCLGFDYREPEAITPLAELSSALLHPEYLKNWASKALDVLAFANGEY